MSQADAESAFSIRMFACNPPVDGQQPPRLSEWWVVWWVVCLCGGSRVCVVGRVFLWWVVWCVCVVGRVMGRVPCGWDYIHTTVAPSVAVYRGAISWKDSVIFITVIINFVIITKILFSRGKLIN